MATWRELVEEAAITIDRAGVADAEISARWIGREATGTSAADWHEVVDRPATKRQLASFDRMVERRSVGEPLQYVVGSWGFRTIDLMVDRRVLIPRPETETVAGQAIAELDRVIASRSGPSTQSDGTNPSIVADLGTGSGAIGLSVAAERVGTEVWLTDVSAEALTVARANLAGLGVAGAGVRLAEGHWFSALPAELVGRLAVVVSNPPYVASVEELAPDVAGWEPEMALLAADEGRAHLDHLVGEADRWLADDGALVLELDPRQVPEVVDRARGGFVEVAVVDDLSGRARAVVARHPRR